MKNIFTGHRVLGGQFFSFCSLRMLFLSFIVSGERSVIKLFFPICSYFQDFSFVIGFQKFYYDESVHEILFDSLLFAIC